MRVFYQVKNDGLPVNHNIFAAFEGFNYYNADLLPVVSSFEIAVKFDALTVDDIVVGNIDFVESALRLLKLPVPQPDYYPKQLEWFLGRKIWKGELSELDGMTQYPFFVKPQTHKIFDGMVVKNRTDKDKVWFVPRGADVWFLECVDFISEYRIFVSEGKILGAKNYLGDWSVAPNKKLIENAIERYSFSPISYSLDVGITPDGNTRLVEVNDFYALGNYGLDPRLYAEGIKNRWDEMVGRYNKT